MGRKLRKIVPVLAARLEPMSKLRGKNWEQYGISWMSTETLECNHISQTYSCTTYIGAASTFKTVSISFMYRHILLQNWDVYTAITGRTWII